MLEYIILGMADSGCQTGYEIKKNIENGIGQFYRASFGSLYPSLKKLTAGGLLAETDASSEGDTSNGRRKTFYKITASGKEAFNKWLMAPINVLDGQNAHLAKIYFYDKLPPGIRERQLMELEITYGNYLRKLETLEEKLKGQAVTDGSYFKFSTLYYGICITREIIRWCGHIRERKPF